MSKPLTTFSGPKLTGAAARRLLEHMRDDAPNPKAQAALARGRVLLAQLRQSAILPAAFPKLPIKTS